MRKRKQNAQYKQYKQYRKYLLKYTILFFLLSFLVFLPFLMSGKSFIWKADGEAQYYPYLHYMGNWLRDSLTGLFHGELPRMFDFSIGMGDDINSIVRFHPLDFLSALVPGRFTELLYQFLILLRLYLAGLSFSVFCFYWKKPEQAVLTGSMIYIFCGYGMRLVLMHPTFGAPLVILPLLFLAAEQVMRKRSVLFLAVITALGFVSNYYFMYMCSIAMAFYVLLRFFDLYRSQRLKNFFGTGFRLLGGYLLGMGLSAVILLPTLARLASSGRIDTEKQVGDLWFYGWERYLAWFHNLITPGLEMGNNTYLSYLVLVLPALTLLFLRKWKDKVTEKLAFLIEVICLLLPAAGWILSGFNAIGNRWTFILSFTLSFIFVVVEEDFSRITRLQRNGLAAVAAVFVLLYLYRFSLQGKNSPHVLWAIAELLVCTAVLLLFKRLQISGQGWSRILLGITCLCAVLNGWITYGGITGSGLQGQEDRGQALNTFTSAPAAVYGAIEDESFWRADTSVMTSGTENTSVILGYNGISMYNSIVNSNILQYLVDQENPGANAIHRIFGLDGRAVPEALANVKYYMTTRDGEQNVPYGYELDEEASGEYYQIYQNQHSLSLGYTYDTWIAAEDYEKLDPLERQQIMKEAVVLEQEAQPGDGDFKDATEDPKKISRCKDEILTVPVELPETGEGVKKSGSRYTVEESGGSIRIPYERRAGYECYLHLIGFTKNASYSFVKISTSDLTKELTLRGKNRTYSLGQENYQVNLGYDEENGQDEICLTFTDKGKYGLKAAEICYVSMENYEEDIEALNREALENISAGNNTVTGTVNLSQRKFMVFSIPCSSGWSVYVDGEKQQLFRANVMYLGLWLEPGEHEIRLCYCTPGLKPGFIITLLCDVIFLLLLIEWKQRGKTCSVQE